MKILVTGGTKGIGRAIIELFAGKGFDIFTCARNADELGALVESINSKYPSVKIRAEVCDMAEKKEVESLLNKFDLEDGLDVLVNNAGIFLPGSIESEQDGVFEMTMNINIAGPYYLTRIMLPLLRKKRSAHIFNLCSTASIRAYPNGGSYCISKFALLGFSKVLREELKDTGIKVTAVLPGPTLTDSWAGTGLPTERFMKAEEIAEAIYNAYNMKSVIVEEILMRPQAGDI
jgi:short-subunit dehydrogenase